MALLDEQIVEEWLNSNGYFTIRGLRNGVREIDLLAIKTNGERFGSLQAEHLHVEVQISFNPIGYIGGNANAAHRTDDLVKEGVIEYYNRKFNHPQIIDRRNRIDLNANWQYVFIHAVVIEPKELEYLKELGVRVVSYKDVLNDLLANNNLSRTSSIATDILKIVRYMREAD